MMFNKPYPLRKELCTRIRNTDLGQIITYQEPHSVMPEGPVIEFGCFALDFYTWKLVITCRDVLLERQARDSSTGHWILWLFSILTNPTRDKQLLEVVL